MIEWWEFSGFYECYQFYFSLWATIQEEFFYPCFIWDPLRLVRMEKLFDGFGLILEYYN